MSEQSGSSAFERVSDCTGVSKHQHTEFERRPSVRERDSESSNIRHISSTRRRSIERTPGQKQWWKFTLRSWDDDQEQDWWFAGTAIPLLAATMGTWIWYWVLCIFGALILLLTTTLNITKTWWRSVLVRSSMLYRPHQVELREPANTIP
jgi:hypothetical protein